jgi:hypothetical protein
MILPRRRFLGSSFLLGGALLDVLTTPVWRRGTETLLRAEVTPAQQSPRTIHRHCGKGRFDGAERLGRRRSQAHHH